MQKFFSYILLSLVVFFSASNIYAINANEVLTNASEKYQKDGSISAQFTLSGVGNSTDGTITISGDKFHLSTPLLSIWYNGRTQWTYSAETNEVNITEPTVEELQQVNPFAIINSFRMQFNATLLKSANSMYRIQLTPLKSVNTSISKAIVTLNASTLYPNEIALTIDNNIITIKTKNIKAIKNVPHKTFVFDEKKYPNAEIVDLR
jgi:outer membrane lipoprotein-sorting protein